MKNALVVILIASLVSIVHGQTFRDLSKVRSVANELAAGWDTRDPVNWNIVAALAHLSYLAYNDDHEVLDHYFKSMGFDEWTAIETGNTVAYVVVSSEVVVVVVRGSDDIEDWLLNGQFLHCPAQGEISFSFHRGFLKAYNCIRDKLRDAVSQKAHDRKLWLCGHSLGGAIATICAIDIQHGTSTPKPTLVTFGQPRVTDFAGAEWMRETFAGRYLRVVNEKDIVTRVPPEVLRYQHAGRCIRLMEKSFDECSVELADVVANSNSSDLQELERVRSVLRKRQSPMCFPSNHCECQITEDILPQSVTDHYKENYLRRTRYQRDHSDVSLERTSPNASPLE